MSLIQDHIPERKADFPSHEQALRAALAWVRARHDSGALSPGVAAVLKMIETELAWRQHRAGRIGPERDVDDGLRSCGTRGVQS
jgi:hypothetical protein